MNIFFLDIDPTSAAKALCDKHVVKMTLETAQILSTVQRAALRDAAHPLLYKATHANHPCVKWAGSSAAAYHWTLRLFLALCAEYSFRYGRVHASARLRPLLVNAPSLPERDWEDPPLCMPDSYKRPGSAVESYRDYYSNDKRRFAAWKKNRPPPYWWTGE